MKTFILEDGPTTEVVRRILKDIDSSATVCPLFRMGHQGDRLTFEVTMDAFVLEVINAQMPNFTVQLKANENGS